MSSMAAAPGGSTRRPSTDNANPHVQSDDESQDSADNMKDCMEKMHVLMLAIAKQYSIQIPANALPAQPRMSGDTVDPGRWHYDSTKTIDYLLQLQEPPTPETCLSPEWKDIFDPFSSKGLPVAQGNHPPEQGLINTLSWTLPRPENLNGAQVRYNEFGYDEAGYVRRPGQENPGASNTSGLASGNGETPPVGYGSVINEYMVSFTSTLIFVVCLPR